MGQTIAAIILLAAAIGIAWAAGRDHDEQEPGPPPRDGEEPTEEQS